MSVNPATFVLPEKALVAAVDVAEDKLVDRQIAAKYGVTQRTLDRWKLHPAFMAVVQASRQRFREEAMTTGIADKVNRLQALDERWKEMRRLLKIRAEDTPGDVLGGETGLLVRREKQTKFGMNVEFEVDTGLLAELRNTEKQAAQELGQWVEKGEISGPNGSPVSVRLSLEELKGMDPAELVRLHRQTLGDSE